MKLWPIQLWCPSKNKNSVKNWRRENEAAKPKNQINKPINKKINRKSSYNTAVETEQRPGKKILKHFRN